MIPKIIWQTHEKAFEDLEPFQKNIANTWKNLNPGWDYRYVDAEQRAIDVQAYSEIIYQCYEVSTSINQADLWRIITTYTNGGVYADIDSVCLVPLDDMISDYYDNQDMICSGEGNKTPQGSINCANFASVENSVVLKKILDEVVEKCTEILENNQTYKLKTPGIPVWSSFSEIAKANKEDILFRDGYFNHDKKFKTDFNLDYPVVYNRRLTTYKDLSELNNWTIY